MFARSVFSNSAWLIADKILRMGLGLVVWIWFARKVGPEGFGIWNYSIAFASIFGSFATLGMDGVAVRELVQGKRDRGAILGTAFVLRILASLLAALAAVAAAIVAKPATALVTTLVALNTAVFIFQASQVFDYHFQSQMKSRLTVVASNAAFLAATPVRIALLYFDAPMIWFGVSLVAEAAIAAGLLYVFYRAEPDRVPWKFDAQTARDLIRQSWPLLFAGIAVLLYMRLDQVMLASMGGDAEVGIFSAALRISEVWYFIPMAIATAAFPPMLHYRESNPAAYEKGLQTLYDGLAWLGIVVALLVTFSSHYVIHRLYGPTFAASAQVLSIQIWTGVTVAISFGCGKWMLAESLQIFNMRLTLITLAVNFLLNLILIPRFGAVGAAWASLIAQSSGIPLHFAFAALRGNARRMTAAFAAPFRLLRLALKP